jgi:hypothetical protein
MSDQDQNHTEAPPPKAPSHEGKTVFHLGELNNAGEDKDYFPPDKDGKFPGTDHKFKVPKDANENALTPDIEITPDHKIEPITK